MCLEKNKKNSTYFLTVPIKCNTIKLAQNHREC
jgi:hypothetical protein